MASLLLILVQACTHEPFDAPEEPITPVDTTDTNDTVINDLDTNVTPMDTMAIDRGNCHPDTVYFRRDVLPIMRTRCGVLGCHSVASATAQVVMVDFMSVFNTGDVRPGDPEASLLYEVISTDDINTLMPHKGPALPDEQIETIRLWIEQGALNLVCVDTADTGSMPCDTSNISYSNDVVGIFTSYSCITCHNGTNSVTLNNYAGVKMAADSGRLYGAINHEQGFQSMPQGGGMMDSCDLAKVNAWIAAGAPDN